MQINLGTFGDDEEFEIKLNKNSFKSQNMNFLILAKQGAGKTNFFMLTAFMIYNKYMETNGEYGAIPIIFSPLYEYVNMNHPSRHHKELPSGYPPLGIDCLQYTFQICNPPEDEYSNVKIISFDFGSLTPQDIASFAGYSEDEGVLGHIQKLLEELKHEKQDYTVDDFIDKVRQKKTLHDALYYVFTILRDNGLFDNKYEHFDWLKAIKERKPIIFNFGDVDTRDLYCTLTGILLQRLFKLSFVYYNAYMKRIRIERAYERGDKIKEELTEDELFLTNNFYIALFFEEAHQILWNTTSTALINFPAHYVYKKISDLLGRKKGFKYNFLVTQRIMELYKYFRKQQDWLVIGSEVFDDDLEYMIKELKFNKRFVPILTDLKKYHFTFIDRHKFRNYSQDSVSKVKLYISPAGMM